MCFKMNYIIDEIKYWSFSEILLIYKVLKKDLNNLVSINHNFMIMYQL